MTPHERDTLPLLNFETPTALVHVVATDEGFQAIRWAKAEDELLSEEVHRGTFLEAKDAFFRMLCELPHA